MMGKSKYWQYIDGEEWGNQTYLINFSSLSFKNFATTKEEEIIEAILLVYDVEIKDIYSKSRKRNHVEPRHMAMFLIRETLQTSFCQIGRDFKCNHSTVLYACKAIKALIATDYDVWSKYCQIDLDKPYIKAKNIKIKNEQRGKGKTE